MRGTFVASRAQVLFGATPYELPKIFPPGQVLVLREVRIQPQYLLILIVTFVLGIGG